MKTRGQRFGKAGLEIARAECKRSAVSFASCLVKTSGKPVEQFLWDERRNVWDEDTQPKRHNGTSLARNLDLAPDLCSGG